MLVLSRYKGEKLILGEEIELQILDISGNQVRIGINAPKSINIVREEIAGKHRSEKLTTSLPSEITSLPAKPKRQVISLRRKKRQNDFNDNKRWQ